MTASECVRNCEEYLRTYELPVQLREKAREELGETAEVRNENVIELVKMLEGNEEMSVYLQFKTTDLVEKFCLLFLRQSKFDPKKTFERIKKYHAARQLYSQDFWKARFPDLIPVYQGIKCGLLENRDNDGCRILYSSSRDWNPTRVSPDDCLNALGMLAGRALMESNSQVCGIVLIVDFDGIEFRHLRALKLGFFRKAIDLATRVLPMRFKALHIVNESKPIKVLYKIFGQWFPKKIRGRIHFHGTDMESLHRYIDPSILPADLKGSLPPFNNEECVRDLMKHEREFLEMWEVGLPDREKV